MGSGSTSCSIGLQINERTLGWAQGGSRPKEKVTREGLTNLDRPNKLNPLSGAHPDDGLMQDSPHSLMLM